MIYSPNPIEDYFLVNLPVCCHRVVSEHELSEALWNMLWLSNPTIDTLPGSGKKWYAGYSVVDGLMKATLDDLYADADLYHALMRSPKDFLKYWRNLELTEYEVYKLGGDKMVAVITERAEEAMLRLMPVVNGNVVRVQFGRAA